MKVVTSEIVAGSMLASEIMSKLYEELRAQGGSDEDFALLTRPQSQMIIKNMAQCMLPSPEELELRRLREIPIEELDLGERAYNCLKKMGIDCVAQLTVLTEDDLMHIPYFGKVSLLNVKRALQLEGLQLNA